MASAIKHIFGFGGQQQQPTVINARRLRLLPGPATGRNSPRPISPATLHRSCLPRPLRSNRTPRTKPCWDNSHAGSSDSASSPSFGPANAAA